MSVENTTNYVYSLGVVYSNIVHVQLLKTKTIYFFLPG